MNSEFVRFLYIVHNALCYVSFMNYVFCYYFHYFRMQPTRKNVCSGTCSMRGKYSLIVSLPFFFSYSSHEASIGLIKLEKCVIYAYQFLLGLMRSLISEWSQAAKEFQWAKLWCPLFKFFTWSSPRVKNKVLRNSECMQVLNCLLKVPFFFIPRTEFEKK